MGLNIRTVASDEEKSKTKLELLVSKRVESKAVRKQTENDIDKLNKQITEAISSTVKAHYKDTHFRSSVIISEKTTDVRLEVDSWTFLTETLLRNVMNNTEQCVTDITDALDKLIELRKSMEYKAENESFNIRNDEKGSSPIVNVSFDTRTKYF